MYRPKGTISHPREMIVRKLRLGDVKVVPSVLMPVNCLSAVFSEQIVKTDFLPPMDDLAISPQSLPCQCLDLPSYVNGLLSFSWRWRKDMLVFCESETLGVEMVMHKAEGTVREQVC